MEPEKKMSGALVGLIIIIVILVAGGIYMWQSNKNSTEKIKSETATDQNSAELNALETDLNRADTSTGVDASAVY